MWSFSPIFPPTSLHFKNVFPHSKTLVCGCWYMGFIAQTLRSTRNKLNVPNYCGHSCLIPNHWETRDHFQSVPGQKSTTLTSLHEDSFMAPEGFFFGGRCAAWRNTQHTDIYHQRVNNVDLRKGQDNVQIPGSRTRCHVLPVSCGASPPFLEAFPSSCPPGPVYDYGCSALWLDAGAFWISPGSRQTALHAPFLVGPRDLVKTVPLIFSGPVPSTPPCCWSRVITRSINTATLLGTNLRNNSWKKQYIYLIDNILYVLWIAVCVS